MSKLRKILDTMSYRFSRPSTEDEDFSAAQVWLNNRSFGPFINGQVVLKGDSEVHQIVNPWTGNSVSTVRVTTSEDINNAIVSAVTAHEMLKKYNEDRVFKFLQEIAGYLEKHGRLFAEVDSINRGILVSTARKFDLPAMVKYFKYYANVVYEGSNEKIDNDILEPLTVAIMTKDTPLIAFAWLLAPAFALKCPVCLVMPKETALSAMLFAQTCIEGSGFEGILHLLPGNEATVDEIVSHSKVTNVISFGPTAVARHIKEITAGASKLSTAMCGLTQMLVFDTADLVAAVDCTAKSAWHYQGVVPWSVKKVLVQESIFKEFISLLKGQLERLRVGSPANKQAEVGPSYERGVMAAKLVEKARGAGIEVFQVVLPEKLSSPDKYFPPTVLIGGQIEDDQMLGLPVISVVPFRTPKEGIALANNARYALAASIWLENLSLSLAVADSLKMGTVWINTHGVFDPAVPFGGWKESGTGSFGGLNGFKRGFTKKKFYTKEHPVPIIMPGGESGKEYKLYYSGNYYFAKGNKSITLCLDGHPNATIAMATSEDVSNAVRSSVASQERWAKVSPAVRAQTLHNMAERLYVERTQLARFCAKPADFEIVALHAVKKIHSWASACTVAVSWTVRPSVVDASVTVSREPLGVVVVAPDLEDLATVLSVVAATLCYGNSALVVLNVGNALPLLSVFQAVLDVVPSGLVNILTGDAYAMVPRLALHPHVDAIWSPNCGDDTAAATEQNAARDLTRTLVDCGVSPRRSFFEQALTQKKVVWFSKGTGIC